MLNTYGLHLAMSGAAPEAIQELVGHPLAALVDGS